jgi:hypothetical protein
MRDVQYIDFRERTVKVSRGEKPTMHRVVFIMPLRVNDFWQDAAASSDER